MSISQISSQIAAVTLKLPDSSQFRVDGSQIGRDSLALAAKLPRPDPAVILRISHVPESMPSSSEFYKNYKSLATS